eukprot:m.16366 g.16366  ORF g.16366 m.16366 type:complete len:251 (-) comp11012_c0_seq1:118-870(-)
MKIHQISLHEAALFFSFVCACIPDTSGETSSRPLYFLGVGLPKTGTTATAVAFEKAGYGVGHNMYKGDVLGERECTAIFNSQECCFDHVFAKHAKHAQMHVVVTHTANISAWVSSVQAHSMQATARSTERRDYLAPNFFGGWLGLPHTERGVRPLLCCAGETVPVGNETDPFTAIQLDPRTGEIVKASVSKLREYYKLYYTHVFRWLKANNVEYSYVDVRGGVYEAVDRRVVTPFEPANTRSNRGGWPKC